MTSQLKKIIIYKNVPVNKSKYDQAIYYNNSTILLILVLIERVSNALRL